MTYLHRHKLAAGLGYLLLLGLVAALLNGCAAPKPVEEKKIYSFWPSPPDEPHIQFLVSFEQSSDLAPPKTDFDKLIYGKEIEKILAINKPYGVAIWNGRIYVCDLRNGSVVIFDLRNHQTLVLIGQAGGDLMQRPVAIAIASDGMKYVADVDKSQIFVFDAEDRYVQSFGHKDFKPVALAVYKDELFVSNYSAQKVEVFDRHTGNLLRTIGEAGTQPGQFFRPLGIAVDKEGAIYVADMMLCQLKKFDHDGHVLTEFGDISNNVGGMVRPKHIAVDKEGTIYVVDAAFQNVQLFDQIGQVYTFFGGAGTHPGSMYLPAGICLSDDPADLALFKNYVHPAFEAQRLIIVTNQFGEQKVAVYALGKLKPGHKVGEIISAVPTTQPQTKDLLLGNSIPTTQPQTPAAPGPDARSTPPAPADAPPAAPATPPSAK